MNIIKAKEDSKLTLTVEGRLDTTTAPQLEELLAAELTDVKELIIDLKNLEYISSAGLRVLLKAHKTMSGQGGLIIENVNEIVMEVFTITGFSDILTIR